MLRVLKYGTGHEIPKGAMFLSTVLEEGRRNIGPYGTFQSYRFVWHYFLVECDKDGNPPATREFPSRE